MRGIEHMSTYARLPLQEHLQVTEAASYLVGVPNESATCSCEAFDEVHTSRDVEESEFLRCLR